MKITAGLKKILLTFTRKSLLGDNANLLSGTISTIVVVSA